MDFLVLYGILLFPAVFVFLLTAQVAVGLLIAVVARVLR